MTKIMKIFILSPNYKRLASSRLKARLVALGEVIVYSEPKAITSLSGLFKGNEPRIIALDPDFCDWKAPNELFSVPNLKAICLQTTSFSWIDTKTTAKHNIPVTNLRHWSSESVAEWAIMLMFNLARRIPIIAKAAWKQDYSSQQGLELVNKTAGIIGLGHIGTKIGERAKGLGMHVQYWSRKSRDSRFKYVSLAKLMKTSDVIFPAVAQNKQTQSLLSDKLIKTMKPAAMLISIVHNIFNHDLVVSLVNKGKIFGYAFETEGQNVFNNYRGNIWAGPANAWVTKDAEQRNIEQWVQTIIDAAHGKFPQRVN